MKTTLVIAMLLLVPQLAAARVYMCIDEATGKTTFTDKACETASAREEIRVNPINPGNRAARAPSEKTWRSQTESRKTGTQYNARHRALYENKATASTH